MRWLVSIILLITIQSFGQEKGTETIDSSKPIDSLSLPSLEKSGSLSALANQPSDSVEQVIQIANRKIDSLNIVPVVLERHTNKIDSLRSKLLSRIDILSTPRQAGLSSLPADTLLIKEFSELNSRLDSLKLQLLSGDSGVANTVEELKSKITAPLTKIQGDVSGKLDLFSENGVPAPRSPLERPQVSDIGAADQKNVSQAIPAISIGSGTLPKANMENLLDGQSIRAIPDAQLPALSAPDVKGVDDLNVGKNVDGVSEATEQITKVSGQISELPEQIDGYGNDLKSLNEGDFSKLEQLPDQIEKAALESEHLAGLEEKLVEVETLKSKAERFADPMVAKEVALNRAKELAVNHFAGHEEELKAAMGKLSKLKKKFPDAEGTLDLFKKTQDPHRGKHFVERLVPGFTIQVQTRRSIWLDVTPSLFCTITARWSAGIGWNERVAYNWDKRDWQAHERIYGPRASIHFRLKPNFILKGDIEIMNTELSNISLLSANDVSNGGWVWSYFGGVKREFQVSKNIKGNVQIMYNLYDPKNLSPYAARLNVRMGLEFPLKGKRKQSVDTKG